MSSAIESEPTADVELWTLYQWTCHDCPVVDGAPTAYGDGDTLMAAQRAIIRHKQEVHNEWQPAPTLPTVAGIPVFPVVAGRCPSCGGESLFLGAGGHITCSRSDCPEPTALDEWLSTE